MIKYKAKDTYKDKLEKEKQWHTQPTFRARHPLNSRLFYSHERNTFNQIAPKKRLSLLIEKTMEINDLNKPSILIVPIGEGEDIQYIRHFSGRISGVDISKEAIDRIADDTVETHVGDMKNEIVP